MTAVLPPVVQPERTGTRRVRIPAYVSSVAAELAIPLDARGIVVFAEVGGRSAMAAADRCEVTMLREAGFATLTFDLLTPTEALAEGVTQLLAFDIRFLERRLEHIIAWLADHPPTRDLPLALFGVGSGAAAALAVAAVHPERVHAVVSRDGRTELVPIAVSHLHLPTLLVVDAADGDAIQRNRDAMEHFICPSELALLQRDASSLGQPGSHDEAAHLALDWFSRHIPVHISVA